MASIGGIIGGHGSCSSTSSLFRKNLTRKKKIQERNKRASCICSPVSSSSDPYKTLKIHPGASESQIKKAFRHLALQYHPDVCKGSDCGIQFHQINEAYEELMNKLREVKETENQRNMYGGGDEDDQMRGMYDADWDLWEEWMGWEGAGIRDYSSHINPYI